ncbi:phage tail assembly chaperone [Paenibacillus wulumuqiensis]|uniref:phage tail assembly chaperone n=1 Tax=Paenibacillus wulumuqiensis TaxID=1567107 RepID=UPI000619CA75|nr:hypothetical protein [Paenibacillus wulumuqiensis]
MSKALEALLGASKDVTGEVYMERLGTSLKIRPVTTQDMERARQRATIGPGKVDERVLTNLIIAATTLEPDFGNKDLLAHYGAEDAADCVEKSLLMGERSHLEEKIMKLSGYGQSDPVEDAKN